MLPAITFKLARAAVYAAFADAANRDSDIETTLTSLMDATTVEEVRGVLDALNEQCQDDMESGCDLEYCIADLLGDVA